MYGGGVRPGIERDAAELFVAQFERIVRLLDMPMANTRPRSQPAQKDLDFFPSPLAPSPFGIFPKETPHSPHAIRNGLFLYAVFAKDPDDPLRSARFRV